MLASRNSATKQSACIFSIVMTGAGLAIAACSAGTEPPLQTPAGVASAPAPESPASVSGTPSDNAATESGSSVQAVNAGQCPAQELLDDLEDGDWEITVADQRGGKWFTYVDKKGSTIKPVADGPFALAEGGANESAYAARMHGRTGPYVGGYVGMGFAFTDPPKAYDVSCCKGLSFWAKKVGPGTGTVRFKIGDANTVPEGGVCTECHNDFGIDLGFTEKWKKYTLYFDKMYQQSGWGDHFDALVTSKVYHLHWQVNHPSFDYDIWVDDVRVVGCTGSTASSGG